MKKSNSFVSLFFSFLILGTIILIIINQIIKDEELDNNISIEEKEEINTIEYKANETIRIKMTKTGEIIAMDINDYLRGVVPSEMSPTYEIEALKAQALVARTYTYRKIKTNAEGSDADMCDSHLHCQAFYTKEKIFDIWKTKWIQKRNQKDRVLGPESWLNNRKA